MLKPCVPVAIHAPCLWIFLMRKGLEAVKPITVQAGFQRTPEKFRSGTHLLAILAPVPGRNYKTILLFVQVIPENEPKFCKLTKNSGKISFFPRLTKTIPPESAGTRRIPILFCPTKPRAGIPGTGTANPLQQLPTMMKMMMMTAKFCQLADPANILDSTTRMTTTND